MATARMVVLIPGQSISHLNPLMEFAAVCLRRGLAVTVVVPDPTLTAPALRSAICGYAARLPSLTVHSLPVPPAHLHSLGDVHPFVRMQAAFRAQAPGLRDFLRSLPAVHALVADMFAVDALDVAAEVGVPGHLFYCTGANNLAVFLQLPSFCSASGGRDLKDLGDAPVSFRGVRTMPASHLVDGVLDSGTDLYAAVLDVFERMAAARGILVNTFEALESSVMAAIRDGRCLPADHANPSVYCVGPLIAEGSAEGEERHPCLPWLDSQPERSVVFICFGSRCTVSLEQIIEMAKGLEKSGHRFLWVLRAPPGVTAAAEPDAALSLLPDGFLARTADRGLVVTASWVPQLDVLRHASTGAFVTHCGWNSTLEAVATGMPMVCWPLEAEQWMNKVYIVEDMKVGVEVRGHKPGVLVTADNVEATVRQIMNIESDARQIVVQQALAVKKSAAAAWKEGGSSCAAFSEFVKQME